MSWNLYFSQTSKTIFKDSSHCFDGDVEISLFQINQHSKLLQIKKNDSTYLYKKYTGAGNKIFQAYEADLTGLHNGNYYFLDTLTNETTRCFFEKGEVIECFTVNFETDTIRKELRLNDTLVYHMEITNGFKKEWQSNTHLINNGDYIIMNQNNKVITVQGQYIAIKQADILDNKKYKLLLKKYDLVYSFRGVTPETEIPVGDWFFYDNEGKLLKTVIYNWEGCIIGVQ